VPGREVSFLNGAIVEEESALPAPAKPRRTRSIADIMRGEAIVPRAARPEAAPRLFS
jgi:ATP-dependent helicase Lhr and Lhr-like helicase